MANRGQAQAEIKEETKQIYERDIENIDTIYDNLIEQANSSS